MKAVVMTEYGPPEVLKLKDVDKPSPGEDDLLIRVHATSVNYGDLIARNFGNVSSSQFNMPFLLWLLSKIVFGVGKPNITILGSEFAGEVEAVGGNVSKFKPGDQVFGYPGQTMGAYAEYIRMAEDDVLAIKPANMTYEEAAVVPMGSIMALYLLREMGNIQLGQSILIIGASGSIGSAAVQIA